MPITRIQITNMARFDSLDCALPMVALIQGGNGTGKTGLLDCIRFLGESGHDPDMLRGSAAEGETVLTLDDGMQLRVRVTRTETWRGWKPRDGKRWMKGREEIDRIYKAIAYDPLKFLDLKPKEQADLLAALSPVPVSVEELQTAIGEAREEAVAAETNSGMTGLEVLAATRVAIYEARRVLNGGADTQEKHAAELERALPPRAPAGEGWGDRAAKLQAEKDALETEERNSIEAIRVNLDSDKSTAQQAFRDAENAIDADINAKVEVLRKEIAALEQERFSSKEKASEEAAAVVEDARAKANREAIEAKDAVKPRLDALTADLATAQERARAQQQAEGTRKAVEVARQEAAVKRARAKVLTDALERLTALKGELAKRVTIPGAVIEGGRIVREEAGAAVPLKKWNTADQYILALKIGMRLGGGFVCVDHCEAFDRQHREALMAACGKYADRDGVQFLLATVDMDGGPLRVAGPAERT